MEGTYGESISPATRALYRSLLATRVEGTPLGEKDPATVTSQDVRQWLDAQPADRSRHNALTMVKGALRREGVLLDVSSKPPRTKEPRVLSPKEQAELLEIPMTEELRMAVLLAMRCGLRRGEICALRHSDRHEDGIEVRRTIVKASSGEYVEKAPKTWSSQAWVPLPPDLIKLIGRGRKGYVIWGDRPAIPNTLNQWMQRQLKGTKFEKVRLHDLRRTCAMMLLESGADVRTSAEILRNGPEMLSRIYARSRRDLKRAAMKRAYEAMLKATTPHKGKEKRG